MSVPSYILTNLHTIFLVKKFKAIHQVSSCTKLFHSHILHDRRFGVWIVIMEIVPRIRHLEYMDEATLEYPLYKANLSAELTKTHSSDCFFGDFAHWASSLENVYIIKTLKQNNLWSYDFSRKQIIKIKELVSTFVQLLRFSRK